MNKLSFEVVKSLFLEKYPTGSIWQKDNKTCVVFKPETKVYEYQLDNNLQILKRLNLTNDNIMYTKNYESHKKQIAELQEHIKKGYMEDSFFGEEDGKYYYTEEQMRNMKIELNYHKEKVENAILI